MIRAATPDDIPAVLTIWNPLIRDTLVTFNAAQKSLEDMENTLNDKARNGFAFLVAESGGKLAGFATYGQFRAGVGYAHTMEHTIILGANARGKGLGSRVDGCY